MYISPLTTLTTPGLSLPSLVPIRNAQRSYLSEIIIFLFQLPRNLELLWGLFILLFFGGLFC